MGFYAYLERLTNLSLTNLIEEPQFTMQTRFIIQSFNPLSGKEPKIYQIIDSNMAELPNELDNRCLDLIEKLGKKEEGNFEMWDRESLLNSTMKNLLEDF